MGAYASRHQKRANLTFPMIAVSKWCGRAVWCGPHSLEDGPFQRWGLPRPRVRLWLRRSNRKHRAKTSSEMKGFGRVVAPTAHFGSPVGVGAVPWATGFT